MTYELKGYQYDIYKCPRCGLEQLLLDYVPKAALAEVRRAARLMETFAEWKKRVGGLYEGEVLAEAAFNAAKAQSGNYTVDDSTFPGQVLFANGRVVTLKSRTDGVYGYYLAIGRRYGETILDP